MSTRLIRYAPPPALRHVKVEPGCSGSACLLLLGASEVRDAVVRCVHNLLAVINALPSAIVRYLTSFACHGMYPHAKMPQHLASI